MNNKAHLRPNDYDNNGDIKVDGGANMSDIRWTDKVYLDSQGNIRSTDGCPTDQTTRHYEYQAHICNNIIYGGLVQLRASGVPNEDIRVMMKCIGDTFARMSFDDKPIEYYMRNFENTGNTYTHEQTTQELINKIITNVGLAKPIDNEENKEWINL